MKKVNETEYLGVRNDWTRWFIGCGWCMHGGSVLKADLVSVLITE